MNVVQVIDELDGFGEHLKVVIVMPNGTHREVEAVYPATTTGGYPAAGLILGKAV